MKTLQGILLALLLSVGSSAIADCQRDGRTYRPGDKVGPFTCMPDGKWRR